MTKNIIFLIILVAILCPFSMITAEEGGTVNLNNPLPGVEGQAGIYTILGRVVKFGLGITGSLALFMFIYGGFTLLTSGGADDKIKKGKETLTWAIIGIIIVMGSYALVSFIETALKLR